MAESERRADITAIEALHAAVAEMVRPLEQIHREGLQCARGCSGCCVEDITVFTIEAELIRHHHRRLLEEGRPHRKGSCAFLDEAGACRIYAQRPYVCRTQGLPLRWVDEEEDGWVERRDICALNEPGVALLDLEQSACWTLGAVEAKLQALQRSHGADLERVRLRDLFVASEDSDDGEDDDRDDGDDEVTT